MMTTDKLSEAIEALTHSDYRGLMQISANKNDPLNRHLFELGWAGLTQETIPEFSPAGWQTFQVRNGLTALGTLANLAGRRLHRVKTLASCLIDQLLEDLSERRAL